MPSCKPAGDVPATPRGGEAPGGPPSPARPAGGCLSGRRREHRRGRVGCSSRRSSGAQGERGRRGPPDPGLGTEGRQAAREWPRRRRETPSFSYWGRSEQKDAGPECTAVPTAGAGGCDSGRRGVCSQDDWGRCVGTGPTAQEAAGGESRHLLPGPSSPVSPGEGGARRGVQLPRLFGTLLFRAVPRPPPLPSVTCWIRGHLVKSFGPTLDLIG